MLANAWSWTKFIVLMLSVGIIITPDLPLPFVLAIFALVIAASIPSLRRFIAAHFRGIAVPDPALNTAAAPIDRWQHLLPEAPGAPGTVRSRAPALLGNAPR